MFSIDKESCRLIEGENDSSLPRSPIKKSYRNGDFYEGAMNMTQFKEIIDEVRVFLIERWMPQHYGQPKIVQPIPKKIHQDMYQKVQQLVNDTWLIQGSPFYNEVGRPLMPLRRERLSVGEALSVACQITEKAVGLIESAFEYFINKHARQRSVDFFPRGLSDYQAIEALLGACPKHHSAVPLLTHERLRYTRLEKGSEKRRLDAAAMALSQITTS